MKRVYVAGAIAGFQHAEMLDWFRARGRAVEAAGWEPLLPPVVVTDDGRIDPGEITSERIYASDVGLIHRSDLVLAVIETPSTGVGMELVFAANWGIRVCVIVRRSAASRFLLGWCAVHGYPVHVTDSEDIDSAILRVLR